MMLLPVEDHTVKLLSFALRVFITIDRAVLSAAKALIEKLLQVPASLRQKRRQRGN
jgi:hypothetical protein